jgi:hypothetical protein
MAGPHTWGPLTHPDNRNHLPVGAEGDITLSQPMRFEGSPVHTVHYDATDSRHNYETGQRPWESVDVHSGHTSDTDFGTLTGRFEDGPGVWRQT